MWSPNELAHDTQLREARQRVRAALERLCLDEETAANALKLGVKSRGELQHNLRLAANDAMPAIERYTGVLYDALGVQTLDAAARSWVDAHVSVQSALFGLLRADDAIPAYRLSASSRLPGLGEPLARVWAAAHAAIDWARIGWLLDLRSKDYVALAPLPPGAGSYLHVMQRGSAGEVRALNHFNKAAKGELVRQLAMSGAAIDDAAAFLVWAEEMGYEVSPGPGDAALTLVISGSGS